MARRLEDAGAAALVMRSLFAEQIVRENLGAYPPAEDGRSSRASAGFALSSRAFVLSPDAYLEQLSALKAALAHPRHRVPQRLRARAVAGVRAAARVHRRRRSRAEPAARRHRGDAVVGGHRGRAGGDRARGARGGQDPGGGQAAALLQRPRLAGGGDPGCGRGRPRPLQPGPGARTSIPRDVVSVPPLGPLAHHRAPPAAALAGHPVRPPAHPDRRDGRRSRRDRRPSRR